MILCYNTNQIMPEKKDGALIKNVFNYLSTFQLPRHKYDFSRVFQDLNFKKSNSSTSTLSNLYKPLFSHILFIIIIIFPPLRIPQYLYYIDNGVKMFVLVPMGLLLLGFTFRFTV